MLYADVCALDGALVGTDVGQNFSSVDIVGDALFARLKTETAACDETVNYLWSYIVQDGRA
jgi:hypothetical protein